MILVLFGAGASAFACVCDSARPPLGAKLFAGLLEAHPAVRTLIPASAFEVFERENSFEKAMDIAYAEGSETVAPFLREMATYLSRFSPCSCAQNAYRRLISNFKCPGTDVCYASLNYDIVAEKVATELYSRGHYHIGDQPDSFSLLKPHGSCNVLPEVKMRMKNNVFKNNRHSYVDGFPNVITLSSDDVERWCNDEWNSNLAPAMSVYAVGKATPYNRTWVEQQRAHFQEAALKASQILVIGVKLVEADDHIWAPMAQSLAEIIYVNPTADDLSDVGNWAQRRRSTAVTRTVPLGFFDAVDHLTLSA